MSADAETESLIAHEELADSPAKGAIALPAPPISEGRPAVATARDRLDHSLQASTLSNQGAEPGRLVASDEPQYITVQERKLQVKNAKEEPLTLYALCRRWVQNDPEAETATLAKQEELKDTDIKREPPEPIDDSSVPSLPGAAGRRAQPEGAPLEDLRKELRDRALGVRSHFRAKQQGKAKACVRRIAKLMAVAAASAPPMSTSTHPSEPGSQQGAQC